jgi:hypothetical protein
VEQKVKEPKVYVNFYEGYAIGYENRKTKMWRVDGQGFHNVLGWILWFGRWRQYAFQPNMATTYSAGCLEDIAKFVVEKNREHREHLFDEKRAKAEAPKERALEQRDYSPKRLNGKRAEGTRRETA